MSIVCNLYNLPFIVKAFLFALDNPGLPDYPETYSNPKRTGFPF